MRKILEKTIIRGLLKYDFLSEAEIITGQSYKEDENTTAVGWLLMSENRDTKNKLLDLNDDTKLTNNLDNYLRITKDEGFDVVLKEDFYGNGCPESLFVLWNDENAILLVFDTYEGCYVNGGGFSYNWKPKSILSEECQNVMTGGCLNSDGIWIGKKDCREALRLHLSDLRENGIFVKPWVKSPFLWLLHYMDTKNKDYNYKEITAQRIAKFPEYVRKSIVCKG